MFFQKVLSLQFQSRTVTASNMSVVGECLLKPDFLPKAFHRCLSARYFFTMGRFSERMKAKYYDGAVYLLSRSLDSNVHRYRASCAMCTQPLCRCRMRRLGTSCNCHTVSALMRIDKE